MTDTLSPLESLAKQNKYCVSCGGDGTLSREVDIDKKQTSFVCSNCGVIARNTYIRHRGVDYANGMRG